MKAKKEILRRAVAFLILGTGIAGLYWAAEESETWYAVTLASQKVGFIRESVRTVAVGGTPFLETETETRVVLNRLNTKVEMSSWVLARETASGELAGLRSEVRFSTQPVKAEVEVRPGGILLRTFSGEKAFETTIPYSGTVLGPEGVRLLTVKAFQSQEAEVEFQIFLPEFNSLFHGTRRSAGRETIQVSGRDVEARVYLETFKEYPAERRLWLDDKGDVLRSSEPSPFGEMTAVLSSPDEARDLSTGGRLPEEQYAQTIIRSNIRLPEARLIEAVTLRLEHAKPDLGWPDLGSSGQKVLEQSRDRLILEVRRPSFPASGREPAGLDVYLRANSYLDKDDPEIRKAVAEALGDETDAYRKALRLKNWVGRRMRFDLGIALAPSSEAIRNFRGTCTEYAILLAALCRAAEIPSRFVMGYVYVNGVWGGHAWVEAYLRGAWVPLDAAVIGPGIADAARLAVAASSLNEGPGEALATGQRLFGNIKVVILSYTLEGRTVKVDPRQLLSSVEGNSYINHGLGLKISKPKDFVFQEKDGVWPERTLCSMKGPGGGTSEGTVVRLLQESWRPGTDPRDWAYGLLEGVVDGGKRSTLRVMRRETPAVMAPGRAAAAFINGVDIWILEAQGKDAEPILMQVLRTFSLSRLFPEPRGD